MARDYIRPDLSEGLLAELVPANTRVLINPTWKDLTAALAAIQRRTRKTGLPAEDLRRLFDTSQITGFFSAAASSALLAPSSYGYDYPSTQAAACHLGDGLTGYVLSRTHTPPGGHIPLPVYPHLPSDAIFEPQDWLNSIAMVFWTRLTDDEISALERKAIGFSMIIAARRREESERRDRTQPLGHESIATRVESQLNALFNKTRPTYTTFLSQACHGIAATLNHEGRDSVPWREFKQRWASVASRYCNEILPVMNAGLITTKSLMEMQGQRLFSLSFGLWNGSQRIFRVPQLVFRVEACELLMSLAKEDEGICAIVEKLKRMNEETMRFHPTRKWTAGWLRAHIDDANRIVFVDEIQSDTLERLRKMNSAHHLTSRIEVALRPWNLHGFASICRWAHDIGYAVGTHSEASRDLKHGMTQSARKWNVYYDSVIRLFDLHEELVPGYPERIMTNRHKKVLHACSAEV